MTATSVRRQRRLPALVLSFLPLLAGAVPTGRVEVVLEGLRNSKGVVRICLTRNPALFPDCNADPRALSRTLPAAEAKRLSFADLPPGNYAVALFHDENRNAKLDTLAAIPREGFGFSRNPRIRFGAPNFAKVAFAVSTVPVQVTVRMQYFL